LAPAYEEFNEYIRKNRQDVILARLEGEMNDLISEEYGISSFPKVVLFLPGSTDINSIFKGKRTLKGLVSWIEDKAPNLTKYLDGNGKLSLKLLEDEQDSEDGKDLVETIQEHRKQISLEKRDSLDSVEVKTPNPVNISKQNEIKEVKVISKSEYKLGLDVDFVKEELKLLNQAIDKANKEFLEIKENKKPLQTYSYYNFSSYDIIVIVLVVIIIVSAYLTFQKIYQKL
jgi:hypothetical protein